MYRLYWNETGRVLCLQLSGAVTLDEFAAINQALLEVLHANGRPLVLMLDLTAATSVPFPSPEFKASQTYSEHALLKWILVVTDNKLLRLMMLLTYNLTRPSLQFFDSLPRAQSYAQMIEVQ